MDLLTWCGNPPQVCELCRKEIKNAFVEGTMYNSIKEKAWACMCLECHKKCGIGLGVGVGQQYEKNVNSSEWLKVKG